MKKLIVLIPLLVGMLVSCSYDDGDLWDKVDNLDERITSIEKTLTTMNASISQMNTIVSKLEAQVSIDSVVTVAEGYQIYYSDGTSIVLKNGSDGADGLTPYIGSNGDWWIGTTDTGVKAKGTDGSDGKNGSDGLTPYIGSNGNWWIGTTDTGVKAGGSSTSATNVPIIGIEEYQGTYYWTQTLNGKKTWLTDSKGNKLPVSGYKPLLRTSADGYWMVSYDGGVNYEYVTDEQGNHVSAANCNCTQFFQSVSYYDGVLTLVLVDGTVIRIENDSNSGQRTGWENAGSGTFTDNTFFTNKQITVEVQHAVGGNTYRIVAPYNTLASQYFTSTENIQFTLNDDGTVGFEDGVYDIFGYDGYEMYFNAAGYSSYCKVSNDKGVITWDFIILKESSLYTGGKFSFDWTEGYPLSRK